MKIMNDKLKIMEIPSRYDIGNIIEELKKSDTERYGVIIYSNGISYPVVFQGYRGLEIEGHLNILDAGWVDKASNNHHNFEEENLISLSPKRIFYNNSYSENQGTGHILLEGDYLVLGLQTEIEACYKRQCELYEKRKADSKD